MPSVLARHPLIPLSSARADTVHITITPNDTGNLPGKLADVEVHVRGDSLGEGLTLIGVSI